MNKVILMGRLTRDIELKTTGTGKTVGTGSLATNKVWKDANGKKQEKVEFHNLVIWNVQADNMAKYAKKGSQLLIEGEIATRSWQGDDGRKNYRTEVIVEKFWLLGSKPNHNDYPTDGGDGQSNHGDAGPMGKADDINVEDIPF